MTDPRRVSVTPAQRTYLARLDEAATQAERVQQSAIAAICLGADPPVDVSLLASVSLDGDALVCVPRPVAP